MAYGVNADVTALVPVLASLDNPTTGNLDDWLTRVSAVINSKLAASDYAVPIAATDTNDYATLTHFCTIKVASMAIQAATLGGEWANKAEAWSKEFESMFPSDQSKSNLILTDQNSATVQGGIIQLARPRRRSEYGGN